MISPSPSGHGSSLPMIECGLTTIAVALSFFFPRLGASWFAPVERAFARLAQRKPLTVTTVGLSALLLRLVLLPLFPVPLPFIHDDFSFLLAADTFAHGRLTNPMPAMWTHFESFHITMQPTYMSMYFPGWGLVLAAGQVLFGNPWFASLCIDALLCATLCWMLQAWLPPGWALLGGMLAVLRLGLFSYWINTLSGGAGLLAALGGALVLGSLPRLTKTTKLRHGLLLALGAAILALTRPYEGLLLCLPVAIRLVHWAWRGKNRPRAGLLIKRAAVPLALLVATLAWLGYYDYRAFGNPLTLPYTVDRAEYAVAPYFVWQQPRPAPQYRHEAIRRFYTEYEMSSYWKIHSLHGFIIQSLAKILEAVLFFAGFALMPPLLMVRRVLLDRRTRFLVLCISALIGGMAIEIFIFPHYMAPFTAVFYALGLQATRHLRLWKPEGRPVGVTLVRLSVVLCVLLAGLRLFAEPLKLTPPEWPLSNWNLMWFGPGHYGTARAKVETHLKELPGRQLAIVHYKPDHNPLDEWVYNRANINDSKVIWARDESPADNLKLLRYYRNRRVWLVEPDTTPPVVIPYNDPSAEAAH